MLEDRSVELRVGLADELDAEAEGTVEEQEGPDELARLIAANAPLTLRATKEALRRMQAASAHEDEEDLILMCYMSADFREGMDAFLNKRPPQWKGE